MRPPWRSSGHCMAKKEPWCLATEDAPSSGSINNNSTGTEPGTSKCCCPSSPVERTCVVTAIPLVYRALTEVVASQSDSRQDGRWRRVMRRGLLGGGGPQLWCALLAGSYYLPGSHRVGSLETRPPLSGQLCTAVLLGWSSAHRCPWGLSLEHGASTWLSVTVPLPPPNLLALTRSTVSGFWAR